MRETGNPKYNRTITQTKPGPTQGQSLVIDVYDVWRAFSVVSPELQHAGKKLLCCGIRGKGDKLQDLREIIQAIERAIEVEEVLNAINTKANGNSDKPT